MKKWLFWIIVIILGVAGITFGILDIIKPNELDTDIAAGSLLGSNVLTAIKALK